ncbi:HpcH/HpaI aldolase/citrate lyase family protein [Scleromatobacter humisilvae]|uniref:Aldolase/citrate lyase family protein n=1 Tax=Scleromatobacter humisilvae TaxID=2897159 RepID=A0A9X1YJT8_9BURK|nr:aldolase/citrate lyase family protein [Scleromatobacter humisilvae]MCK9687819.1 aldolase/citrate lyase family protein [Scleromatobacter humisilvae]
MHTTAPHPRDVLFEDGDPTTSLPVCDHYSGVEARMRKSLELQAELGPVFDVTLDGEDGAPAGGEVEQAHLIAELVQSPANRYDRVGARIVPRGHPAFEKMLEVLLRDAGTRLAYLMIPKSRDAADLEAAVHAIDVAARAVGLAREVPLHALVETHGALRDVELMAAHPRLESLSFGLMDFVSAHRGAIPQSAMSAEGQFAHPLVVRAKLAIAAACHGHSKTPSHCVVTEFKDARALQRAAERACREFGYTRMWSIHPDQVEVIVDAFAPTAAEVDLAVEVVMAAQAADWGPIRLRHNGREHLHDRASYRYFWHVIERAHRTSAGGHSQLPAEARVRWFGH